MSLITGFAAALRLTLVTPEPRTRRRNVQTRWGSYNTDCRATIMAQHYAICGNVICIESCELMFVTASC